MPQLPVPPRPTQAINVEKWTPDCMKAGWMLLPNVLIEKQRKLGLSPSELNLILHLAVHWWFPETLPHPSKARIAEAMGIGPRQVQRLLAGLEQRGLLTRRRRGSSGADNRLTNEYDLSGLISQMKPLAENMVQERQLRTSIKALRNDGGNQPVT